MQICVGETPTFLKSWNISIDLKEEKKGNHLEVVDRVFQEERGARTKDGGGNECTGSKTWRTTYA